MSGPVTVYTIGHSTRGIEDFLKVLKAHGVNCLVDIRSYPQSRRHPHFGQEALTSSLAEAGVRYVWMKELGGRRRMAPSKSRTKGGVPGEKSPHSGVRAEGFRAYIEHLSTEEASQAIEQILALASTSWVALMCAEKNYHRCHRQFLADRLKSLGAKVLHIENEREPEEHNFHPLLIIREGTLLYPSKEIELPFETSPKSLP